MRTCLSRLCSVDLVTYDQIRDRLLWPSGGGSPTDGPSENQEGQRRDALRETDTDRGDAGSGEIQLPPDVGMSGSFFSFFFSTERHI